ncbi:hypothetical protein QMK19_19480 [Streptomyces sp. H10-C2]|nr:MULTISPECIES: hypothetical protein [unclassified Streptomyces]MDJ0343390.1 hypothetical protein [Streptomyces sp. PH10-H1]MDJ0371799.1 hypothetical protein [Streptomyces sp. H10-C2]
MDPALDPVRQPSGRLADRSDQLLGAEVGQYVRGQLRDGRAVTRPDPSP